MPLTQKTLWVLRAVSIRRKRYFRSPIVTCFVLASHHFIPPETTLNKTMGYQQQTGQTSSSPSLTQNLATILLDAFLPASLSTLMLTELQFHWTRLDSTYFTILVSGVAYFEGCIVYYMTSGAHKVVHKSRLTDLIMFLCAGFILGLGIHTCAFISLWFRLMLSPV